MANAKSSRYDDNTPASVQLEEDGITRADVVRSKLYVWDTGTLAWVKMTQPGGGGGGGGAVTIADGADVAQGTTTDLSSANTVIGLLKAIKAVGPLTDTQLRATAVPVSGTVAVTGPLTDAQLRALAVPVSGPLTDAQLRAAVVPISDGGGSVTVDSPQLPAALVGGRIDVNIGSPATLPVSGPLTDAQLRAAVVPVSGPLTDAQLRATPVPISAAVAAPAFARLSDGAAALIGQKAAAASLPVVPASDWLTEAVPSGGFGNPALRVFVNSLRKATYYVPIRGISSGALVANTLKQMISLEHALASTKNARIRRIIVTGVVSAAGGAVLSDLALVLTSGTAASSAGTVVTPGKANAAQTAADTVVKTLPTIVAAGVGTTMPLLQSAAAGLTIGTLIPRTIVYDWSEGGSVEPFTLRAGVLEGFCLNLISTSTPTVLLNCEIEFTEE